MPKGQQAIDFSGLDDLIREIDALDGDVKQVVKTSLMESARRATSRMQGIISDPATYPAKGIYSKGETAKRALPPEIIWRSETDGYVRWGIDSKDYKVSDPATYPAKGIYSKGETAKRALPPEIIWRSETDGYVRWGIDSKDYKVPFYMMYGTDRVKGSSKLRNAIFSASIKKDFETDLEEQLQKAVDTHVK